MATRAQNLAEAYVLVARANHFMVGVAEAVTADELAEAEQILITQQNAGPQSGAEFACLNLALDLIEDAIRNHQDK